jgi:hypothetical protein
MLQEHARADGIVRGFVNQNEGTCAAVVLVAVTADRLGQTQVNRGNVIHLQLVGCCILSQRIDIQTERDVSNLGFNRTGCLTQCLGAGTVQWRFREPTDHRLSFFNYLRRCVRVGNHVATRDIDFVSQTNRD